MLVGSLFSGIGGLDLGLSVAGHDHAFLCEADPYRQELLRARFPGTPVIEDVRFIRESTWGTAADGLRSPTNFGGWQAGAGLLCGGFPCQDLSVAGKRAGLSGERSGLFYEFARIAAFLQPKYILLENVPGLFSSHGGRDFGIILETLANLRYGVAWRTLDSRFFGVPQRRRRVFIVGTITQGNPLFAAGRSAEILAVGQSCGWHPTKSKKKGKDHSVASISGLGTGGPDDNDAQNGRLVTGPLLSNKRSGYRYDEHDAASNMLQTIHFNPSGGGSKGLQPREDLANPITASHGDQGAIASSVGVRRLTPIECERLQGFPDNWTKLDDKTPDNKRYAALGDAITVPVAYWIGTRFEEKNENG